MKPAQSAKRTTEQGPYLIVSRTFRFSRPFHGLKKGIIGVPAINRWATVIRPLIADYKATFLQNALVKKLLSMFLRFASSLARGLLRNCLSQQQDLRVKQFDRNRELPLRYGKLKSSIKVIKRKQNLNSNIAQKGVIKKAGARSKREIAMTVKNWIVELRQERQTRTHLFAKLPD